MVAPLTKLTKKDVRGGWANEQDIHSILCCPDFKHTCILQTDASNKGLSALLFQVIDGRECVTYASRLLKDAELKYSATEKEYLAVTWGIHKKRPYLKEYHFKVITDHQSIKWLHSLQYRKGALNGVADALSRQPLASIVLHAVMDDTPNGSYYNRIIIELEKSPKKKPKLLH